MAGSASRKRLEGDSVEKEEEPDNGKEEEEACEEDNIKVTYEEEE